MCLYFTHAQIEDDENTCAHEAVEACTQPLKQYDLEGKAVFPQIYEAEMDRLCE